MKFYVKQHKYYCGVDLHARNLYVCIIDQKGVIVKHKNIDAGKYFHFYFRASLLPDFCT